jgi:ribokinase
MSGGSCSFPCTEEDNTLSACFPIPRNRKFEVVVVGGANWDYTVHGGHLPAPGETAMGESFHEGPGGKGCNQAVAAARLGARTAFVGRLGADERGDWIFGRLVQERVTVTRVKRDPKASTGIALIMVADGGEKQILAAPGANRRMTRQDVRDGEDVISDAKVLLVQLEVPLDVVAAALTLARGAGVCTVLDPAPAVPLPDKLLALVDVIKPNAVEAEALTGIAVDGRKAALAAAKWLLARGPKAVAIQAGHEGDLLVTAQETIWLPRLPVTSVDATGAGDAFAAGLAVMLAEEKPLDLAGRFASAAAALETTGIGAQAPLPTRELVSRVVDERGEAP